MDRATSESTERIGSVKAVVGLYGGRIHGEKSLENRGRILSQEKEPSSKTGEFHLAKWDIGSVGDCKIFSEIEKARAESELHSARRTVKDLTSQIEASHAKARVQKEELQLLKKSERYGGDEATANEEICQLQYMEVMHELENVKQELSKLKLDMASALEVKRMAEKQVQALTVKSSSCLCSMEELRKEIEVVNEENVLVEIARIEAVRESKEIEAQREADAAQFSKKMRETKAKMKEMAKEINSAKGLEMKLQVTNSDLNVLQSEMELVRAMEKNVRNNFSELKNEEKRDDELESGLLLRLANAELEAAKKELVCVKDESFQLMASMDAVRVELKRISRETARLKRVEEKQDFAIQNLNSKLLKARFKLEAATVSKENATAIVTNLSAALQHLQSEMEVAKKEKGQICNETDSVKMKIKKTNSRIEMAEQQLEAAMQELEVIKVSESVALDKLRILTERTLRERASSALHSSTIRISKFEYDYLIGQAKGAHEIADKKVAANQAWVEALKASENDITIKTEIAQRKIRDLQVVEEKELNRMEKSLLVEKELTALLDLRVADDEELNRMENLSTVGKEHEGELNNWGYEGKEAKDENFQLVVALPRKSLQENGNLAPSKRSRTGRQSISSGTRHYPRSPSITLKKRRKVMPNLVKFIRGRGTRKQK